MSMRILNFLLLGKNKWREETNEWIEYLVEAVEAERSYGYKPNELSVDSGGALPRSSNRPAIVLADEPCQSRFQDGTGIMNS